MRGDAERQADMLLAITPDQLVPADHPTQYLNSYTEQSHRAVKQRYYPMLRFGSFESAARFCAAFDELRQYFRWRRRRGDSMPLAEQRRLFSLRWDSLLSEMVAA